MSFEMDRPGNRLRALREQRGLTMRDVENASARIADRLRNEEYAIPPSRLSDIEAKGILPSVYRLWSFSIIYELDLLELLSLYGINEGLPKLASAPSPSDSDSGPALPGDVIAGSFTLEKTISRGALGATWLAIDVSTNKRYVVKLFPRTGSSASLGPYIEYMRDLSGTLQGKRIGNVLVPTAFGQFGPYFYQVIDYLGGATNLAVVIRRSHSLTARYSLSVLGDIADALSQIHKLGVLHADIKPSNILISGGDEPKATIADFGMAKQEQDERVLLLSTVGYLHPDLRNGLTTSSDLVRTDVRGKALGPYIDVYSAGIVAFEMLTGSASIPELLTESSVGTAFEQKSPGFSDLSGPVRRAIARLVFRMLSVSATQPGVSAIEVMETARSLIKPSQIVTGSAPASITAAGVPPQNERVLAIGSASQSEGLLPDEFREALERIEKLGRNLAEQTAVFIAQAGGLQSVPNPKRDEQMLDEVHAIFDNSLRRTQSSWMLGVGMTVTAFAVIVVMMASAIVVTILTRKPFWGALFGTLGVSSLIGTLMWRPFDRIFRATIISQQIEMIHVQTITGFRGTLDFNDRKRICSQALTSLQTLFREHASPEPASSARKHPRKPRPR